MEQPDRQNRKQRMPDQNMEVGSHAGEVFLSPVVKKRLDANRLHYRGHEQYAKSTGNKQKQKQKQRQRIVRARRGRRKSGEYNKEDDEDEYLQNEPLVRHTMSAGGVSSHLFLEPGKRATHDRWRDIDRLQAQHIEHGMVAQAWKDEAQTHAGLRDDDESKEFTMISHRDREDGLLGAEDISPNAPQISLSISLEESYDHTMKSLENEV